ncbi:putative m serotype protein [Daldinia childiae]|uniref:putative m serotype protein n=1 Tax=Daldinia childiae TaxID=326645 RepID=UPI001447CAAF|nr:putative m serotype protein [Daldinia childiae]KAF3058046.1 putative m serotype protein [Daldinia childiae]
MSATPKKPLSAAQGRSSSTENTPPSRQTRASTPTSSTNGAGTTNSPQRTRSNRGGTPMSARAAATHRTTSSLSISSTVGDAEARAETVALIEDLKERLQKADIASEQHKKQAEVLQTRLDDALKEQAKLEEKVHESEEQIEALRNEKREAARQMREMEAIYEAERSSMMKEKEEMANREEEMQAVINRLKETLNQKNAEDENRPTRQCEHPNCMTFTCAIANSSNITASNSSPNVENGNFAPPSSIQRSDSRNNSKLLLQKDKLIESLRLELAEAQIKLVESENQGGGRVHEVERLLMEARMANARLMEDNESYQLLLQEKTLHGEFGKGDFGYMNVSANQDALNALEGRSNAGDNPPTPGASLADELGALGGDEKAVDEETLRRLETELRAAKDQNKALTLYINKIIERLLQHQEFEHILDQSSDFKPGANLHKDLPPPPTDSQGASFLSRAKSIAAGPTPRPKPRPMTMSAAHQIHAVSAHTNPRRLLAFPSPDSGARRAQHDASEGP